MGSRNVLRLLCRGFSSRGEKAAEDVLIKKKEQKLVEFYRSGTSQFGYSSSNGIGFFFAKLGTRNSFSTPLIKSVSRESTEDTVFKYFMEASSSWLSRRLKNLPPLRLDKMIRFTTFCQGKEARLMDFALGGPSGFSIPKTYEGDTAARALARVVSPLVLFCVWLALKFFYTTKREAMHDEEIEVKNVNRLAEQKEVLVRDNNRRFQDVDLDIQSIRIELPNKLKNFSDELKKKKDKEDA